MGSEEERKESYTVISKCHNLSNYSKVKPRFNNQELNEAKAPQSYVLKKKEEYMTKSCQVKISVAILA